MQKRKAKVRAVRYNVKYQLAIAGFEDGQGPLAQEFKQSLKA